MSGADRIGGQDVQVLRLEELVQRYQTPARLGNATERMVDDHQVVLGSRLLEWLVAERGERAELAFHGRPRGARLPGLGACSQRADAAGVVPAEHAEPRHCATPSGRRTGGQLPSVWRVVASFAERPLPLTIGTERLGFGAILENVRAGESVDYELVSKGVKGRAARGD